ncbi:MAG TPA: lipid-binding SYLF domain-containing protein [Burkholderiaceae bacterium]|nr:lipid-binding SYLF domain-containing protein [Burkholderiaceae bacterium]HYB50699.1 lipid-binding SYLF domain-containing protein [Burkholderiaceae bacterium]
MYKYLISVYAGLLFALVLAPARADEYTDTIDIFKNAGESGNFFNTAYGYAVFPTVGKAGFVVGGAYGTGRVYEQGKAIGDTSMVQLSVGFQLGGEGYSEIIFFEDQRALKEFTSGNFEFGADASVVAITAAAGAKASTTGSSAGASGGKRDATTVGNYSRGMATFTVAKGGLMYEASINGQKFSYKAY